MTDGSKKRLGGWMRIWLAFSVLWIAFVILIQGDARFGIYRGSIYSIRIWFAFFFPPMALGFFFWLVGWVIKGFKDPKG